MLTIIIIVFLIILAVIVGISFKLYDYALNPKSSKEGIFNPNNSNNQREEDIWIYNYDKKEYVYINSFDNLKLHGYKIKNNSSKWAITVHGYTNNAEYMSPYAYKYYTLGYNLLMPDLRGHGKSEGNYIGMGWHDRLDILKWIEFILKEDKEAEILLHGVSMGAATVMMVSGEDLPPNVKVIIEDCGYTSAWSQFAYQLKSLFKLHSFPMLEVASLICKIKSGFFISKVSPIKQIKKSITPTLFIHGDNDDFVPFFMLDELYNAFSGEKEKLVIHGAAHAKASYVNPQLYWTTIETFLKKYIK